MSVKGKTIFIVVAIFALIAAYTAFTSPSIPAALFDSSKWKAAAGDRSSTIRLAMLNDLLSTHQLIEKNRTEVINLLGNPEGENYFSEYDVMYRLGNDGGLLPGPKYLAIRYTSGETIDELAILRD